MKNLRSVNLNLLPILLELLRKRNVTHAANTLNMSQPAVSEALSRLRYLFHDDLLISKKGRTMGPTSLAMRIEPILEASLEQIEALLSEPSFDPSQIRGSIKIATVDYVVLTIGQALLKRLKEKAPKLTLHFIDIAAHSANDLRHGELDFIFSPPSSELAEFERQLIFEDNIVCMVDRKSSFKQEITEDEFWNARHAAFSPGDSPNLSLHSTLLHQMGRDEFNAVLVQNFMLLPYLLEGTDTIAIMPQRITGGLFGKKIRPLDVPFNFPKLRVFSMWCSTKTTSPAHRWFRETLAEVAMEQFESDSSADS